MPNYVANRIEFFGEQKNIDKVFSLIKGNEEDYPYIDFNVIISRPDNLIELEARDWNIDNWGTKWNADEQWKRQNIIYFETAWCVPFPIYNKITEICNQYSVTFSGMWCNEDWCSDSGKLKLENGELFFKKDNTDKEHQETCIELWGYDPMEDEEE